MGTYEINGTKYPIIGAIKFKGEPAIPIVDIKMMTPEEEHRYDREHMRGHFLRENGREPANDEECETWYITFLESIAAKSKSDILSDWIRKYKEEKALTSAATQTRA